MKAVVVSVLRKLFAPFRRLFSLLHELTQKLWLLPPCRRIDHLVQKTWNGDKHPVYHFLPYMTSVLRVLGWAVLVIGVTVAIVLGLRVLKGGLTFGGVQFTGIGPGIAVIVLGIAGSFLAWLFLLVIRELIYLFIHVKENTRNTAEGITSEPD
jgi:hypothetical protein